MATLTIPANKRTYLIHSPSEKAEDSVLEIPSADKNALASIFRLLTQVFAINKIKDTPNEITTIMTARTTFRKLSHFAIIEIAESCRMLGSMPNCLATRLVNRRLLVLIDSFIRMLKLHTTFIEGNGIWSLVEARNAVFVMGQVHNGIHRVVQILRKLMDAPTEQLPQLGAYLRGIYRDAYGNNV